MRLARLLWLGAMVVAACSRGDDSPALVPASNAATIPSGRPPGFDEMPLVAADSSNPTTAHGVVWYRQAGGAIEWYVQATGLEPGRAYRVELVADNQQRFAADSRRADAQGAITAHGTEHVLADEVCVGADAAPTRALSDVRQLGIAVKTDGSINEGAPRASLMSPTDGRPCTGNGDGRFDYILLGQAAIPVRR